MPFELPPLGSETPQERWARIYSLVGDYRASVKKASQAAFATGFAIGFIMGAAGLAIIWAAMKLVS